MPANDIVLEALKQLSRNLRTLIDLSRHETNNAWDEMVNTVRKEISTTQQSRKNKNKTANDDHINELVSNVYDHLIQLIKSIRDSQKRLKHLATRDLLTGLYNRNFFNESIVRDIQKARRNHEKLSFLVIDIDGFKKINDTYGHLHGDGVIKECAQIIKSAARQSDFVCRYGGDEFVIITPMASCNDNNHLIRRIRDKLRLWNSEFGSSDYNLSLSIGCAVWEEGRNVLDVLREADQDMYRDKERHG